MLDRRYYRSNYFNSGGSLKDCKINLEHSLK